MTTSAKEKMTKEDLSKYPSSGNTFAISEFVMKIIVVCIVNYCRSPVAEYILKSKLTSNFTISSAGISPYLGMNNMDKRSISYLKQKGISSSIHIPRKLTEDDMGENDLILALDLKVKPYWMNKFIKTIHI